MSEIERRIRLAEAMGRKRHEWRFDSCGGGQGGLHVCKHCDRSYCSPPWTRSKLAETEIFCDDSPLPDPFTNANDCEAVIRWLQKNKYDLSITIGWANNDQVTIRWIDDEGHRTVDFWRGKDWKQGVCKLALKVLNTDREGQ